MGRNPCSGDDASEADLAVLEWPLATPEPLAAGELEGAVTVDTGALVAIEALAARWLAAR